MLNESLRYFIALSLIKRFSHSDAKRIVAEVGSPDLIFKEKANSLAKLSLKRYVINQIRDANVLEQADDEIEFINKNRIKAICINDSDYPYRLAQCHDSPLILYMKGETDLNAKRMISIVGTRKSSTYGSNQCDRIIASLSDNNVTIISGLAHGIDTRAHKSSLLNQLDTIAVLGHGLNHLYPHSNRDLAASIIEQGCLITDFPSTNKIRPGNFPSRNRIIAGLSDVCLVVESNVTGGSIITADLAYSYDREVCALPGRNIDINSSGCNFLIKKNKAALVETGKDIKELMNWDLGPKKNMQQRLFHNLTKDEVEILSLLTANKQMRIDLISVKSGKTLNKTAALLLQLEFKHLVKSMPGNIYGAIE